MRRTCPANKVLATGIGLGHQTFWLEMVLVCGGAVALKRRYGNTVCLKSLPITAASDGCSKVEEREPEQAALCALQYGPATDHQRMPTQVSELSGIHKNTPSVPQHRC